MQPSSTQHPVPTMALFAASGAALVGAAVWAAISYFTGYEVGYVAWGIGLLVGVATLRFGGRGVVCAGAAAALTLVGIFAGKLVGTHFLVEKDLTAAWNTAYTTAMYEELKADAAAYAALPDDPSSRALRRFMVDRGYVMSSPGEISKDDLQAFKEYSVPMLERLHADAPSYEQWRQTNVDESRASFDRDFSLMAAVGESLNAIDLLFGLLAVSTAFGMVRRADQVASAPQSRPQPTPQPQPDAKAADADKDPLKRAA